MKLLFDENLSPELPRLLAAEYPGSAHVREKGLRGTADSAIWNYCRDNAFILVSKDADFGERSLLYGFPPKVIWLNVPNSPTSIIVGPLLRERSLIEFFAQDSNTACLILSLERTL